MSTIIEVHAREILDSRGNPTVEAESCCRAARRAGRRCRAAPRPASTRRSSCATATRERYARQGRARGGAQRERGARAPARGDGGRGPDRHRRRDDGRSTARPTRASWAPTRSSSVSLAVARAAAQDCGLPLYRYLGGPMARVLPVPMMNILNGGAHASNNVDAQEFMVVPIGADTFPEGLRMGVEVFHALKKVLGKMGLSTAVGDEGGFAPMLPSNEAALDVVMQAIQSAGLRAGAGHRHRARRGGLGALPGRRVRLQEGRRQPRGPPRQMVELYAGWVDRYPIVSIEDGLAEDDWDGWALLTERLQRPGAAGGRRSLRAPTWTGWARASRRASANAVLIKVNQIGTLTETLQCIELAKGSAYGVVISHRSGETEDTFIADLAVATERGADQDRQRQPHRPHRQVQPAAPDRRGAGRPRPLSGTGPLPAVTPRALGRARGAGVRAALRGAGRGIQHAGPGSSCGSEERLERAEVRGLRAMVDSLHAGGQGHRARPAGAGAGGAGAVRDDPARGVPVSRSCPPEHAAPGGRARGSCHCSGRD